MHQKMYQKFKMYYKQIWNSHDHIYCAAGSRAIFDSSQTEDIFSGVDFLRCSASEFIIHSEFAQLILEKSSQYWQNYKNNNKLVESALTCLIL